VEPLTRSAAEIEAAATRSSRRSTIAEMHRTLVGALAASFLGSFLFACGGNVVFVADGGDGGQGGASTAIVGAGGAPNTSVTVGEGTAVSVTGSSSSGVSCENDVCMIGQVACSCDGQCSLCNDFECFLFATRSECQWADGGAKCDCFFANPGSPDGELIGSCAQSDLDCDTVTGCCGPLFESAALNP